jgi:hypothetical protein
MKVRDDTKRLAKLRSKDAKTKKPRDRSTREARAIIQTARTEVNKMRRLARCVLENPNDKQAARLYAERYGLESLNAILRTARGTH